MNLRGVVFNYAFDQSGVRNFDGKGYPNHKLFEPLGLTFRNCSFVSKTTVIESRLGKDHNEPGNMRLREDGMTPVDFWPDCIYMNARSWMRGAALNAVGLSGPGLEELLRKGVWHNIRLPFMISLASTATRPQQRLADIESMVSLIKEYLPFRSEFGIQLNISCVNVDHGVNQAAMETYEETLSALRILRQLGDKIPLVLKINTTFSPYLAIRISEDENCDGFCVSNTLAWDDVPAGDRLRLFGTTVSPLIKRGYPAGGISGSYLLEEVCNWLTYARSGLKKPIIAGGGILHRRDVNRLAALGASAIAVGSVSMLRPWRVQSIIDRATWLAYTGKFVTG